MVAGVGGGDGGEGDAGGSDSSGEMHTVATQSKLPARLEGRSAYLCRRGYCAKTVVSKKGGISKGRDQRLQMYASHSSHNIVTLIYWVKTSRP